jgi:hypothetical protein
MVGTVCVQQRPYDWLSRLSLDSSASSMEDIHSGNAERSERVDEMLAIGSQSQLSSNHTPMRERRHLREGSGKGKLRIDMPSEVLSDRQDALFGGSRRLNAL